MEAKSWLEALGYAGKTLVRTYRELGASHRSEVCRC